MASFTHGIGKGLREPCSPYREAYVFGAELNEPKADGWNCIPAIVSSTTSFDLSAISPGREVVVALLGISGTPAGAYAVRFRWYRERDNALLYDYTFNYTALSGGWIYGYSYIGYVDWEINENGSYYALITVTGALSFSRQISFTVSGIPEEVEPEPVPTGAMGWISQRFVAASGFFYQVYLETLGWVYPFWLISGPFYSLSQILADLSWDFYDFNEWVEVITDRILGILSWSTIWSYIKGVFPKIEELRDWFDYWGDYVTDVILSWWSSTSTTVLGWIDEAKQWTWSWIDYLQKQIDELRVMVQNIPGAIPDLSVILEWFRNWPGHIISVIDTWWTGALSEVQGLINSAFIIRDDFWQGWQDWRDKVTEFFTDPEDWLYKSMDRIIERFW